jgi:hypothetical protein
MAQSSRYYKIDDDILLEFIWHDQANPLDYDIEVDNNGSEIKIINTVLGDSTQTRHLVHELGSDVVNFDVTTDMGYVAIENFASRSLLLETGKTYKFNLTALQNPALFTVSGNSLSNPLVGNIYSYIPQVTGSYVYELTGFQGGKVTVSNVANPLFATPDEETGNSIKTGSGAIERYHGIEISDGKYALLDTPNNLLNSGWAGSDTAEVNTSQAFAFNNVTSVRYDKVRLHLRTGFSFAGRGKEGFIFEVKTNRTSGIQNFLTQIVYLNTSSFEIKNPKPFVLGELLYSSFIEVKIPSLVGQYQDFANFFYDDGTGTSDLDPTSNYDVSLKLIDLLEDNLTSVDYVYTGDEKNLMVSREDEFQDFTCVVEEAEDGNYFKIYGEKDNSASAFEAYIIQRTTETSDDISVIFDISVQEQIGQSFIETSYQQIVLIEDFEEGIQYRPIIKNSEIATSFSIDATMRIYNQTENTQILKTASLISNKPAVYGKKMMKINLNSGNNVTKIYNTLPNLQAARSVAASINNALPKPQVKYVPAFLERLAIKTNVREYNLEEDTNSETPTSLLRISPYDSYIKIDVTKKEDGEFKALSFLNAKNVKLEFTNGTYFNCITSNKDIDLGNGEFLFKIDKANAAKIQGIADKKYYISLDNGSDETLVYQGRFINV